MATPAKKQSFLGGAAILAAAVVIVKLIGAAYKIPLSNILGSAGQTYFDTAYQIYNFLLTFSTAGLPLAIRPTPGGWKTRSGGSSPPPSGCSSVWVWSAPC